MTGHLGLQFTASSGSGDGRPCGHPTKRQGRRGFALIISIFALVIIGAVVAGGYFVAAQQFRVAAAGPQASSAFYAAEAGLNAAMAEWDSARADSLEPGAAMMLKSGQLESGDEYSARIIRLDAGQDQRTTYYLAIATGRAHGPRGGRRQVALFLRGRRFEGLCCDAALSARGAVRVAGGAAIRGLDLVPPAWASVPDACQGAKRGAGPGILSDAPDLVELGSGAVVEGDPPIEDAAVIGPEPFAENARLLQELAELADLRYAGGVTLRSFAPATTADGECARSAPGNWGAPDMPDHACFDYYPIVYVDGDLSIDSPGRGQGILLVEGDFELGGGFEFNGVVIVRGRLITGEGGGRVWGGVVVHNVSLDTVLIGAGAEVDYSGCAVHRALWNSKVHLPQPLAEFAWFEILE